MSPVDSEYRIHSRGTVSPLWRCRVSASLVRERVFLPPASSPLRDAGCLAARFWKANIPLGILSSRTVSVIGPHSAGSSEMMAEMGVSHTWASHKQVSSLNLQVSSKSKSFFVTIKQVKSSHSFGQASHKSSHTKVLNKLKTVIMNCWSFICIFYSKDIASTYIEEFKLTQIKKITA